MISFRKKHPVVRKEIGTSSLGFPSVSMHGVKPWEPDLSHDSRMLGVLFTGMQSNGKEDFVYLMINSYWEPLTASLPSVMGGYDWKLVIDTMKDVEENTLYYSQSENEIIIGPLSVMIFELCEIEEK